MFNRRGREGIGQSRGGIAPIKCHAIVTQATREESYAKRTVYL